MLMSRMVRFRFHMTFTLVEDWMSHGADILVVGGWSHQLVTGGERRVAKEEGDDSSARHVTQQQQPWLGTWKMWTVGTWDRFQGEEQTGFKRCRQVSGKNVGLVHLPLLSNL